MKKINENLKIPQLFLEKLELLTREERQVLIKTIDILNHPIFITRNVVKLDKTK